MTKRGWTLMLALGLCLSLQACGDDDSGEEEDGNDSGSGGSSGRGGTAGRGGSGAGSGASGSGNSGSGSIDDITECMAQDMMMGGNTSDCEGLEEYSACTQEMCDVEDCGSQGCQDYFDCVEDADDPCNPTGCTPSSACTSCLAQVGTCSFENCFDLIMCGEVMAGGACDQLDECCETFSMPMICEQAAAAARAGGGDALCETAMAAFCM